jgi:hypothetical protein
VNLLGKPDAGNLHVRFDEGDQGNLVPTLPTPWNHLVRVVPVNSTPAR